MSEYEPGLPAVITKPPGSSLVRRSFVAFVLLSAAASAAIFARSRDLDTARQVLFTLDWKWLLAGIALASMDWWGGGLRLWITTRYLCARPSFRGMVLAAGINAWGANLTPSQTGGGPVMIWAMHRFGIPYPQATMSGLVSFTATIIFLTIVGVLALALGAGDSLGERGIVLGVTMRDLFRTSVGTFAGIGFLTLAAVVWPRSVAAGLGPLERAFTGRWRRVGAWIRALRAGTDSLRECMRAFLSLRGLSVLVAAVACTPLCYVNRLLASYLALRALHIEVPIGDVVAIQALLSFVLYFAPTPGGSGIAEVASALAMGTIVPPEILPGYTVIWRFLVSYLTVAAGFLVFGGLVGGRFGRRAEAG